MLTFMPSMDERTVAFKFDGRLTKEDALKLDEVIARKQAEDGTFNIFAEVGTVDLASIPDALREVRFDMSRWMAFNKVALLSEQNWLQFAEGLGMGEIARLKTMHFNPGEYDAAWEWLKD
ncbi:STAS/SEC14 domain-containing protein [Bhargavaea ginsengi]|uniref:STAS/SEC14 domain-containing protein n=1 Tax=Bhargavaea ginsengi TaxID=426757 RepID=UPI00203B4824|nr:STAS/SEC14 domain-containing protein [Bhargavaea ginsengi]MCM3086979.1 STAS/SEC14 domain-containing protein [Bhargavaea ginsengi]